MKMKQIYITFHISYKYSTYQIVKNPCNEKQCQHNIQVMGREKYITQET